MNHMFFSYPAEAGLFYPLRTSIRSPMRFLVSSRRFGLLLSEGDKLDLSGLTKEAIELYRQAAGMFPWRPEPHIKLAGAMCKLDRRSEAKLAIEFARNRAQKAAHRFHLAILSIQVAYEEFLENKNPVGVEKCLRLVRVAQDIWPNHIWCLAWRVVINFEMAIDPSSSEVRRSLHLENGFEALAAYTYHAASVKPAIQKYVIRFAYESERYLPEFDPENKIRLANELERIRSIYDQLQKRTNPSKHLYMRSVKNSILRLITVGAALAAAFVVGGIGVIDCIDIG